MESGVSGDDMTASLTAGEPLLSDGAAWVDGELVPINEARIPILDTGFLRSDATYDVVAVWHGSFFRLSDHLDRFERSCRELRLRLPYTRAELSEIMFELVRRSGLRDSYVEVVATRGVTQRGIRDPRRFENRFYAYAVPYVWLLAWEERDVGMDAVIVRSVRRIPPTSLDPTVKNFHWGDLTRGLYEAYDRGARYPILLDDGGNIAEGPGYNLFAVVDNELFTPQAGALEGITRRSILELAERAGLRTSVSAVPETMFRTADELFATSTAGGVMAITSLDGEPVGDGEVGPITQLLRDLYWAAHYDPDYTTPIDY